MDTTSRTNPRPYDSLVALRRKASELVAQSDDEEVLAKVVAMFSGKRMPCTYSKDEFAPVLKESESDHEGGQCISHDDLFAKYGL